MTVRARRRTKGRPAETMTRRTSGSDLPDSERQRPPLRTDRAPHHAERGRADDRSRGPKPRSPDFIALRIGQRQGRPMIGSSRRSPPTEMAFDQQLLPRRAYWLRLIAGAPAPHPGNDQASIDRIPQDHDQHAAATETCTEVDHRPRSHGRLVRSVRPGRAAAHPVGDPGTATLGAHS